MCWSHKMKISLSRILIATSAMSGVLAVLSSGASAFTFTTNFTATGGAEDDIFLDSVVVDGETFDFSSLAIVESVDILANDEFVGGNTGAASTDAGDAASTPGFAPNEDPSGAEVAAYLGNNNLNNIVDTEDDKVEADGSFEMELTFDQSLTSLLIWERGINSDLGVRVGGTEFLITSDMFVPAGYTIDTTEIPDAQEVGSYGLDLSEFGPIDSLVLFSTETSNGPDFKVAGIAAASIPEPATILGLAAFIGAWAAGRNRFANADS